MCALRRCRLLAPAHLMQTLLELVQLSGAYALMLIVMTYSVWLVLAVLLGCATGY